MAINNPLIVGLAEVTSGYTGSVTVTVGVTAATYTPQASESPLSVMYWLQSECYRVHGAGWSFHVTAAGKIVFQHLASTFSISSSGTTQTRLGLTGTLSGSSGYTFPNAYANGLIPDRGVALDGSDVLLDGGAAISDGSNARAGWRIAPRRTLTVHDDAADQMAHQALLDGGGTWDLVMPRDGAAPHPARFRVLSTSRRRLMSISSEWALDAEVLGVLR